MHRAMPIPLFYFSDKDNSLSAVLLFCLLNFNKSKLIF